MEHRLRYQTLVAKHFGWQIYDRSISGCCNSIILRRTMRDCINLLKTGKPIVALIQLTHLERFEYAGTPSKENSWKYGLIHEQIGNTTLATDDPFESINPLDEKHWPAEIVQYAKQHLVLQKHEALTTNLLHGIIGLSAFFKNNNIQYLIYAGPSYRNEFDSQDAFYQYLLDDPNILNLTNFNMLDLTGQQKHPDPAGMKTISDYFINQLGVQE